MQTQCCVCLKIKQADGTWKEHHEKIYASHGYCPACKEIELKKIRKMQNEN
jgi:hypothetical protein